MLDSATDDTYYHLVYLSSAEEQDINPAKETEESIQLYCYLLLYLEEWKLNSFDLSSPSPICYCPSTVSADQLESGVSLCSLLSFLRYNLESKSRDRIEFVILYHCISEFLLICGIRVLIKAI